MKKFLTLVLALVMALAIAVPAMAFVGYDYGTIGDPTLDFYFVDYTSGMKLFDNTGVYVFDPAADRGYALNEVVGVVASIEVPKGYDNDNVALEITGKNVKFFEQAVAGADAKSDAAKLFNLDDLTGPLTSTKKVASVGWMLGSASEKADAAMTLQYLALAKVVDEEASVTAKLYKSAGTNATKLDAKLASGTGTSEATYKIDGIEYKIVLSQHANKANYVYTITAPKDIDGTVYIITDGNFKSSLMVVTDGATDFKVDRAGALLKATGFVDPEPNKALDLGTYAGTSTTNHNASYLLGKVTSAFAIDPSLVGNPVKVAYFNSLLTATIDEITLDIEPWTAYVSIPDIEVSDPPKTGDAASMLGFVMIIAALAGVVVFKKVRA